MSVMVWALIASSWWLIGWNVWLARKLAKERELRLQFERLAETYASDADVLRRVLRQRGR